MAHPTPLKRLSVMAGRRGLSELHIPTITEDAEDVAGMQGRIRLQKDDRVVTSSQWMDKQRNTLQAYEYLCHIGEAKEWIEDCLQDEIDPVIQLEESMRNGVVLARLARWIAPEVVRKIFQGSKLQFRHSDNINYFFEALKISRLPSIFWFELTDLYEKKNIPKVIYCIHALSHLLAKHNLAPNIKNLLGQLQFTNEELSATQRGLDLSGVAMPNFSNVGSSLRKELNEDEDKAPLAAHLLDSARGLATPDLVIGEESDSEEEHEKFDVLYWSDEAQLTKVVQCQAWLRTWLARREFLARRRQHRSPRLVASLTNLQAHARGRRTRSQQEKRRAVLTAARPWVVLLQTAWRRHNAQRKYKDMLDHYQSNIEKVIKVQGIIRNKLSGNAYRKLTTENNPSIRHLKSFIHLLDDSDLDFDRELALEDLRQQVIEHIRENNSLEEHVNMLDIQIALFLRNAITIDDVLRHTGAFQKKRQQQRRIHELASNSVNSNPLSLTDIDKVTRGRLELYQQLVYLLQTEPKYLSRLLAATRRQELGGYSSHRMVESTVLTLFGYATNSREEYLLINLCKSCIAEEMKHIESAQEFMRGDYTFMKLVVQTNRGAKEREFFRKLLSPLVTEVVSNDFLDLEIDPVSIYHKAINEEESRTGRPSMRKHAVNSTEALDDREVRDTFILHLRNLREITSQFLTALTTAISDVPYGIRVVARELRVVLEEAFPDEPRRKIVKIIGNFIYYRYLNPAIVAPEQYDVIDAIINPIQRKNLAEISKMLQQISSGKVFEDSDVFLAPLNDFVVEAGQKFARWFIKLTDVQEPETHFEMHSLSDQIMMHKPNVYIAPTELFHLHYILQSNLDSLEDTEGEGMLRDIIEELGPSPFTPDMELHQESIICLTLTNRCSGDIPGDQSARLQQLLVDTKRLVTYVIKIQAAPSLREIFDAPVQQSHENAWNKFKESHFSVTTASDKASIVSKRRHLKLTPAESALDLESINFYQLKSIAHRLVVHLERCKVISDNHNYQEVINMIARDITGKNSRRVQRDRELARMRQTLDHLQEKREYLLDQRSQYEGYLNSCMTAMATKSGKKAKFILPFSRQYFHIRGLQKQGMVPKFGSYKYTAKQLYDRGVLVQVDGIPKKHYDRIPLILSMDQVGMITIEGSYAGWQMSSVQVDIPYDHLLQTQFDGVQTMAVLDGMAKVNVNLLIYLINKKFYT